jgi:membrane fusion protein (multidrug efflux system)
MPIRSAQTQFRGRDLRLAALILLAAWPAIAAAQLPSAPAGRSGTAGRPIDCLISPRMEAQIGSPVEGVVRRVLVDRGQEVKAGDLLVELDDSVQRAGVALKRAQESFGERRLSRNKPLFEKDLLSEGERDEIRTQAEVARLERIQAETLLEQRFVRAPFNGVVMERHVAPGDRVHQEKMIRLARIDPLNVELIVPARMMRVLNPGMKARVANPDFIADPVWASVEIIDRVVDPASGTIGVRLILPNPAGRIPAGIPCTVSFDGVTTGGR